MYRLAILSFVFGAVSLSQSQTQLAYAKLDVPGAVATEARGVNNLGEIVGFYKTAACSDYDMIVPNCAVKGFKFVNNKFVKLMVPNSTSTAILGVNDNGDLVGFYRKPDGSRNGFVWWHTNVVQTLNFPATNLTAVAIGINKAGKIVGGLWSINSSGTFANGGFTWKSGTFTTMNFGTTGCVKCTSLNGISNAGNISGQAFRSGFWTGLFKAGSDNDFFKYKTGDTRFTGVNDKDDILGIAAGATIGFYANDIEAGEGTGDATETKPTYTVLQFPGNPSSKPATIPFGINNVRGIVGAYWDTAGKQHGFLAKASSPQYLYVTNAARSNTISGFQISTIGTLTPLPGFPVSTTSNPDNLSAAKHSLLVGATDINGNITLSLYDVARATGKLTLKDFTYSVASDQAVLDFSAKYAYVAGGSVSGFGTLAGFNVSNGTFIALPGSPYQFSIGGGSNPVSAQRLLIDPDDQFIYMPLSLMFSHTPAPWFGVVAHNSSDGSVSNFNGYQAGCIAAGGMAALPRSGSTLVYSSCVDQFSGLFSIDLVSIDQSTGALTDLGLVWIDPTNTKEIAALAIDPSGKWLLGLEVLNNVLHIMRINSDGSLTDTSDHDFQIGTGPFSLAFDSTGQFLYVVDRSAVDVLGYAFDHNSGLITPLPGSPYAVVSDPLGVAVVEP
jgi:6-phosphogluconolactonase